MAARAGDRQWDERTATVPKTWCSGTERQAVWSAPRWMLAVVPHWLASLSARSSRLVFLLRFGFPFFYSASIRNSAREAASKPDSHCQQQQPCGYVYPHVYRLLVCLATSMSISQVACLSSLSCSLLSCCTLWRPPFLFFLSFPFSFLALFFPILILFLSLSLSLTRSSRLLENERAFRVLFLSLPPLILILFTLSSSSFFFATRSSLSLSPRYRIPLSLSPFPCTLSLCLHRVPRQPSDSDSSTVPFIFIANTETHSLELFFSTFPPLVILSSSLLPLSSLLLHISSLLSPLRFPCAFPISFPSTFAAFPSLSLPFSAAQLRSVEHFHWSSLLPLLCSKQKQAGEERRKRYWYPFSSSLVSQLSHAARTTRRRTVCTHTRHRHSLSPPFLANRKTRTRKKLPQPSSRVLLAKKNNVIPNLSLDPGESIKPEGEGKKEEEEKFFARQWHEFLLLHLSAIPQKFHPKIRQITIPTIFLLFLEPQFEASSH